MPIDVVDHLNTVKFTVQFHVVEASGLMQYDIGVESLDVESVADALRQVLQALAHPGVVERMAANVVATATPSEREPADN